MPNNLILISVIFGTVLLVGAGCSVPGEKDVISGSYLQKTSPPVVSIPAVSSSTIAATSSQP